MINISVAATVLLSGSASSAWPSPPPKCSCFEEPTFGETSATSDSELISPLLHLFPPFRSPHPTLQQWTELNRRNDDDLIVHQQHVTFANLVRSNAMGPYLVRTASVRTIAVLARSQVRSLEDRRALRTHQQIASPIPTRYHHNLARDVTQTLSLYALGLTLTILGLRYRRR